MSAPARNAWWRAGRPGRRQPPAEAGDRRLTRTRIYILPTRAGLGFGGALALMLLTSVNYALPLGYALTFLMAGVALAAMIQTVGNLNGLVLRPGRIESVHAGDTAELQLSVRHDGRGERPALRLEAPGLAPPVTVDVTGGTEQPVRLALRTARRGRLDAPRLVLSTRWPLGLWRAWTVWRPATRGLVWPALETPAVPLPRDASFHRTDAGTGDGTGEEDLAALRPWRPGDGSRRVAWAAMARQDGDALLVKDFDGDGGADLLLDWQRLPASLDTEARLSRLARWVRDADAAGLRWGLRLPGVSIDPDRGPAHRARCLDALARAEA